MIRVAALGDIDTLISIGRVMHNESAYKALRFNDDKVGELLAGLIAEPNGVVFIAERAGVILGGFAGGISDFWFSNDSHAFDYGLFILPEHRGGSAAIRLLSAFESWAKDMGAKWCDIGITTGVHVEQTARMYEKLGYDKSGLLYRKALKDD
jgi:GNAT superfamily N-acetyltransferase